MTTRFEPSDSGWEGSTPKSAFVVSLIFRSLLGAGTPRELRTNNRIFISFAIEDKWAKEYLVGQTTEGARWEMQCAVEERIPIIGVHTDSKNKGAIPPELAGKKVIEWTWDGIARFLNSL